jgi:hypothetical protein
MSRSFGRTSKYLRVPDPDQKTASLAAKVVTLQPAMIEESHLFSDRKLLSTSNGFYEKSLNCKWIDPQQLGQLPNPPGGKPSPCDSACANTEKHRLWQVWIETP